MSANLQVLVDSIEEGLLVVGPDGGVRLANQAARRHFPVIPGKPFPSEEVLKRLAAVGRGYAHLPLSFEINSADQQREIDRLHLKIVDSPLGGGYLMLIRNVSEEARFQTIISNFANLMDAELSRPMREFSQKLGGLLVELVPELERREALGDEMQHILRQGEELAGRMKQMATYAQVFAKAPILASERLPVMDLIAALLVRVKPLLDERKITLHQSGISQELPVIYGSREWLVESIYGYIEHLVRHCRVRSDLEFQVRPYGNFISFQIRNHGRSLPKLTDSRAALPFARLAGDRKESPSQDGLGLGLALCKQIVELHRGSLRLSEEEGDITAFVIELPAGAPPEAINPDLGTEQARRYAEDLTRLIQRQRSAAAPL